MLRNHKYVLDLSDLQYKRVKLHWKVEVFPFYFWFAGSVIIALIYGTIFENIFGSPKERLLNQQIENMKLQYSLIGRELDNSLAQLEQFQAFG